jgi:D-xylonolactonase
MEPELIADYECLTGEGPLWHPMEKRLYWLDIPRGRIFRYDPASGTHEICYEGEPVGGMTVQADGALLLFMDRGAIAIWRDGELSYVVKGIPGEEEARFNDAIADPAGRVFCGTMCQGRAGTLYRLDVDGSITAVVQGVGLSNGMGFTPDRKGMYHTDSRARRIYRFDYDEETGVLSDRRVFVETPAGEGIPDGMTVDLDGYVWSARWDGACLVRYTPQGIEERRIPFPAQKVSSVTFGGENLSDIYVTTGGGHNKVDEGPGAGALFRLRIGGIQGVPEFLSRTGL